MVWLARDLMVEKTYASFLHCIVSVTCGISLQKVGSEGFGITKHTIETSLESLNITDVNNHVASSVIAVVADIFYNRAVVIHYGKVIYATNILTGESRNESDDSDDNKGPTKTALGAFTIHALEYCPPWLLRGRISKETLPFHKSPRRIWAVV